MEHRMWPNDISAGGNYSVLEKKVYSSFSNNGMEAWFLLDIDPVGSKNEKVHWVIEEVRHNSVTKWQLKCDSAKTEHWLP